jgi:hypothetical protein
MTTTSSPTFDPRYTVHFTCYGDDKIEFGLRRYMHFEHIGYTNEQRDKILDAIAIERVAKIYGAFTICLDGNFDLFIPE